MYNVRGINLIILLFSRVVSELGNAMFTFALGLFVLDTTQSSFTYSLILGSSILARSIANIVAGFVADRWNKKTLIFSAELVNAIVLSTLAVLLFQNQLMTWVAAFIGSLLLNIFGSLLRVSINAAIPEMLDVDGANKTNGLFHMISAIALIVGPVLSALLYEWIGLMFILIWSAASYTLSGTLLILLRFPKRKGDTRHTAQTSIKEAVTYIRSYRLLSFFLKVSTMLNFIMYPAMVLVLPYIAYQVIGLTGAGLGFIQACWAGGMTCGSLVIIRIKRTEWFISRFFDFMILQAVIIAAWAFPVFYIHGSLEEWTTVMIYCILVFGIGMLQMFAQIPLYTYFQFRIASQYRGKVWGLANTLTDIAAPAGLWLYGLMLENVQWTWVTFSCAIVLAVISAVFRGRLFKERLSSDFGADILSNKQRIHAIEPGVDRV
jgi:DHA3 family macrolide efflux protein-like MFS transporter